MDGLSNLQALVKALEGGQYNAAPSTLSRAPRSGRGPVAR
jgi:hypothetical protein